VFCSKLVKYGFVDEFMVNCCCCCCCCYEMLLLMIHTIGVHNHGFVVWIELLLRVFVKMVELMNCVEMTLDFKFDMFWEPFSVYKPINKLWGRIMVLGESKLGFLGEKWWKTRKNRMKLAWSSLMASSVWKQLASGQKLAKSKLFSDKFPCFAFLCLFHTFMFWIGLWCKHQSFR